MDMVDITRNPAFADWQHLISRTKMISNILESASACYKNYMLLANAINEKKKIAQIAPVGINTMAYACLFHCIIQLCTVFVDNDENDYNFDKLLSDFEKKKDILIRMSGKDKVTSLLENLKVEKTYYTESIERLRKRRNKVYVHNDSKFFCDFEKINKELPLFFADKETLIDFGIKSCDRLRDLFNTPYLIYTHMTVGDEKDFSNVIDFIEKRYK